MAVAGEGEVLYSPLGFNEAALEFEERYRQENWGNFRNGQDLRPYRGKMRQPQFDHQNTREER